MAVAKSMPTATAEIRDGRIRVRADFALLNACRALPNRLWDPDSREWIIPLSAHHARALLETFGTALRPSQEIVALADRARPTVAPILIDVIKDGAIPGERTPAWSHQRQAYWFTRRLWDRGDGGILLAMDMGVGKSLVAIDLICTLRIDPVLILCPKAVVPAWERQFEIHGWDAVIHSARGGSIAKRTEAARKFLDFPPPGIKSRVIVANYESIDLNHDAFLGFVMAIPWQLVVCDEVHRIKDPGGKRSRALSRLANSVPRRLGLTGTPLPHSPMDAYAEFRFLDKRIFGTSLVRFRSQYAIMGGYGNHQIVAWRNQDEFARLMGSIMFQARADDVLDLPEAIHVDVPVVLEPATLERYRGMERDFVVWVRKEEAVTASNALARLIRLQQIVSGYLPDPIADRPACRLSSEKEDALGEVLEELPAGEPVVVFCRFHHDLDAVARAAAAHGRQCLELSGRVNELEAWQKDGEVLAAQIQAGKEGIDLSRARHAVYFNQTFSLGDHEQSLARIRRPGQKAETVFYHHLIARGTIDEKIREALKAKRDVVQAVLEEARRPM